MAYTVSASFDAFYDAINLSGDHRETANTRKESVVELLEKHFEILEAFPTGSIPKFTALKNKSDVDVMVALHFSKHIEGKSPSQVLEDVRNALAEYRTGVRKNGQAVTLYYKTWPNVDIVPVSRSVNDQDQVTHYNVPDANKGAWIKSRPKTHAKNIEDKASACGANFRRIIKMVKHWNSVHSDYLQSYHIEVLALQVSTSNMDDTPWEVYQFFKKARPLLDSNLWYETGFADEYLDYTSRQEAIKRFDAATDKARDAWFKTYGSNSDHAGAIKLWKQLFGDAFPAYG